MKTILAGVLVLAMTASASAQTVVRIATAGDHPPYNTVEADGTPAGFDIALGTTICLRAGLTCQWVVSPWLTLIPDLIDGDFDVIMSAMAISAPRLAQIDFSDPYYPAGISHFVSRAGESFDFTALSGAKIGAQSGTIQAGYLADSGLGATNTVTLYPRFDDALAALADGAIDLVLADRGFIIPRVRATNGALVLTGPDMTIGGGVGAGFRKDEDALTATFDRVIAEMKADGSLNALILQWFDPAQTF